MHSSLELPRFHQKDDVAKREGILTVVVAQLVELLLPTPEIQGSNPVINNFIYYQLYNKR